MSNITLDEKDLEILRLLQTDAKTTAKSISRKINSPITTVYSRINRMEEAGIINSYKTVLNPHKLGKPTTAFILANFTYRTPGVEEPLDQRSVAKEIAGLGHPARRRYWTPGESGRWKSRPAYNPKIKPRCHP